MRVFLLPLASSISSISVFGIDSPTRRQFNSDQNHRSYSDIDVSSDYDRSNNNSDSDFDSSTTTDSENQSEEQVLKLPGVRDVLSNSVNTISRLKAQVTQLNTRIKDIANQEQRRVSAAKIEFEKQLAASEREVEHADRQNGELKEENVNLVAASEVLQHRARAILEENRNLKTSLSSLRDKVQMGVNYASKMERNVDDKGSTVLSVLKDNKDEEYNTNFDKGANSNSANGKFSTDSDQNHGSTSSESDSESESTNADVSDSVESTSNSGGTSIAVETVSSGATGGKSSSIGKQHSVSESNLVTNDHQAKEIINLHHHHTTDEEDENSDSSLDLNAPYSSSSFESGTAAFLQIKKTGIKRSESLSKSESDLDRTSQVTSTSTLSELDNLGPHNGEQKAESVDFDSGSMLGVLNHELKQLKAEEDASIRSLSLAFEKRQKMFRHDKERVLRVQQKLLKRQMKLKHRKFLLESAVKYLENQRSQLSAALVQLGGYLRDLAHVALSPPRESGKMLLNLSVSMDDKRISMRKDGSKSKRSSERNAE